MIHTIPAVVALREHFDIDWLVRPAYRQLVEIVARVRPITRREIRGHETAVDFQGLMKSAALAWLSGAKNRYGYSYDFVREKPAAFLMNHRVAIDPTRHVIEWNLQLASALVRNLAMPRVDFALFCADGPKGFEGRIVLLPGAGKAEKQWPIERFRELASRIGPKALAVWGPGEREMAEAIGCEVAPPTNFRELARVLRDASVVVGSDTGPLHLAAALGTRVVGLYGPTNPRRNGPYGQLANCVETFTTTRSMRDISVDDVMRKL